MKKDGWLRRWSAALFQLFFPRRCVVCGNVLGRDEEGICLTCNVALPRTYLHLHPGSRLERKFWGKFPLGRVSAYFYYEKGTRYTRILHSLKYGGRRDLGEIIGRQMAQEMLPSGFFEGVDVIVPLPLHPRKLRQRGYNQSECVARGLSAVTGIPVDTVSVVRVKWTGAQVRLSKNERLTNVAGIFALRDCEALSHKHVLLVDDVVTTSATLTACADAVAGAEGVRISILAVAAATIN